jgi:hypothetical protein
MGVCSFLQPQHRMPSYCITLSICENCTIKSYPSATASLPSTSVSSSTPPVSQPTKAEKQAQEEEELARDLLTVQKELHQYLSKPLYSEQVPLDLVCYWDVSKLWYIEGLPMALISWDPGVRRGISAHIQGLR